MALSNSDKKEIEVLVRKEIKDFLNANTIKQFENKIVDTIRDEIRRGKIQGDVNEIVTKVMKEFYKIMWTRRSFWEPSLKNVK
jgi:anti-sigma28 factor (negative regulator of flagellin synthesis)